MTVEALQYTKIVVGIFSFLYRETKGSAKSFFQKLASDSYAERISGSISKIERVKTLWSPENEVLLRDFYYPLRIAKGGRFTSLSIASGESKAVNSIDDLGSKFVVVQGIVGQGKSMFLRYLATQSIGSEKNSKIPIFVELRTISAKASLQTEIFRFFDNNDIRINEETFGYLAKSGKIAIFLDAFDELQDDVVKDVLKEIEGFRAKFPEMPVVITSRPDNEIQKVTGVSIVNLAQLQSLDVKNFLQKIGLSEVKKTEIVNAIQSSPSKISELTSTPLMLTLVVISYESISFIPDTLPEFFKKLFEIVFTRHDRMKAGFSRKHNCGLPESKLKDLFGAFCFNSFQQGYGRTLNGEQFKKSFEYAQEMTSGCLCHLEGFKADIVKVSCLMLEEGVGLTTFLHNSIAEFFSAEFISDCTEETSRNFYKEALEDYSYWEPILSFLKHIDEYRYSKFYVLEYAPKLMDKIDEFRGEKSKDNFLNYTDEIANRDSGRINFKKKRNGKVDVIRVGPIKAGSCKEESFFIEKFVHALISWSENYEKFDQLKSLIENIPSGAGSVISSSEIEISIYSFIDHIGIDFLSEIIISYKSLIYQAIENAKKSTLPKERPKIILRRRGSEINS